MFYYLIVLTLTLRGVTTNYLLTDPKYDDYEACMTAVTEKVVQAKVQDLSGYCITVRKITNETP